MVPKKRSRQFIFRLREFATALIRESVAEGDFQRRILITAASIPLSESGDFDLSLLPFITSRGVNQRSPSAIPITAAWQFIRLAAKLFDDLEDSAYGSISSECTNLASSFLFLAYSSLDKLADFRVPKKQLQLVINRFNKACLQTCTGQDFDLKTRWDQMVPTPDHWLEVAQAKSGALFAWASWAGALAAGANEEMQTCFWKYGLHLGILVQIADDFNGVWNASFKNDLSAYRVTLPISYAFYISSDDEKQRLLEILQCAQKEEAVNVSRGQTFLSTLGAQKFMLASAQVQRCEAIEAINQNCLSSQSREDMIVLLNKAFPTLDPKT